MLFPVSRVKTFRAARTAHCACRAGLFTPHTLRRCARTRQPLLRAAAVYRRHVSQPRAAAHWCARNAHCLHSTCCPSFFLLLSATCTFHTWPLLLPSHTLLAGPPTTLLLPHAPPHTPPPLPPYPTATCTSTTPCAHLPTCHLPTTHLHTPHTWSSSYIQHTATPTERTT